ncbi:MAG: M16 family metallopeptidase [Christensenellales bacterium]
MKEEKYVYDRIIEIRQRTTGGSQHRTRRAIGCFPIWVGVGSAYESDENNGLSHFTEHVTFKGTDDLSAFDIAHRFESYGAAFNAFTSKECTCYYAKSIDEYAENCFALLGEILLRSVYDDGELDKERKVIVEEINMVEDTPEDICYDELAAATYGNANLGKTILGPIENVKKFRHDDVKSLRTSITYPETS